MFKCINCGGKIDNFDDVWDHVNGFSHIMQKQPSGQPHITSESSSIIYYSEDEYLFMVNCTEAEFYNFLFVWKVTN